MNKSLYRYRSTDDPDTITEGYFHLVGGLPRDEFDGFMDEFLAPANANVADDPPPTPHRPWRKAA